MTQVMTTCRSGVIRAMLRPMTMFVTPVIMEPLVLDLELYTDLNAYTAVRTVALQMDK